MNSSDTIIMAVGGALIIIGLYLFIAGKKDGVSSNNVEGFGIKLNVSNPSIILIVFGVGLLLVPRLLPETPVSHGPGQASDPALNPKVGTNNPSTEIPQIVPGSSVEEDDIVIPATPTPVYFPQGVWQLTGYEQDGVELPVPGMVKGHINFVRKDSNNIAWTTTVWISDIWGNVSNYQYQGQIANKNNNYMMSFISSNDPQFIPDGFVPLEMFIENNNTLHMKFTSQGTQELFHWVQ
ncbi:hypothetical protein [Neptunicella sp. SCSIO 80796]|uniref:hypothetical protein n=1 Tax=Neptunicella plasticusilytica TaxID=3117012 RepID=UPI003A4D66BA